MPRANRMPRTRRIRRWHALNRVGAAVGISGGAAVARAAAGEQWWWALLGLALFAAIVVVVAGWIGTRLGAGAEAAHALDLEDLTDAERALPYGVIEENGDLLLPTKVSVVVLVVVLAIGFVVGGAALLAIEDSAARTMGALSLVIGLWLGLLSWWIRGARIRLTTGGIESTMGVRRAYTWLDVPEIRLERLIIIMKAAGAPRPRIWIRCGVLEVSVADAVAMIRRQRSW